MATEKKSKKSLMVGIIGFVAILALALAFLLTRCSGQEPDPTGPSASAGPTITTTPSDLSTDLYWNADRAEYDGKSEAGMSSRVPESDGYYHIRFILDGQEVILKATDRRIINKIDSMDLMGLVFDEDGLIVEAVDPEDMPLELVAWKFYVQSSGGNLIKLNSSKTFEGMEFLLECTDNTRIYDMTGTSGPLGTEEEVVIYDRVIAIRNLEGELTHIFIYDRSNYMLTHEAPCTHCEQTVTWYEWTKTDVLPDESGHYQLMNDITVTKQLSLASDTTLCLDLNGHRVDGAKNTRILSLHNPGVTFALMDTSEAQTGVMAGHSESSPQGGVVWVRYGAFYMYGGTLDGSDMVSRLNGTVVQVPKNAFFYMHGGTIIGGTAAPQYNEETGKYTYGLGGSIQITGTMRMYGGTIRDGKAPAAYYYNNGKYTIARGMGGNIFMASGAVLEITGGEILNGYAGNVGGNIMMDGTAELIISGGTIAGGKTDAKVTGKHGGNIYCPAKGTITMTGGTIHSGVNLSGGGGNIYLSGHMEMSDGHIYGGCAATSGGNIMMSGSASMILSGGTVTGGNASGKAAGNGGGNIHIGGDKAVLALCGAKVSGGNAYGLVNEDGTTTGGDGGNINVSRGTLQFSAGIVTGGSATGNGDGIYVAWNAKGAYLSHYFKLYGNGDADITRSANTSKEVSRIFLGNWEGNGDNGPIVISRIGAGAGAILVEPIKDAILTTEDAERFESTIRALPVKLSTEGNLILSTEASLGEGDHPHCLCSGGISGHTCTDTGFVSVNAEEFMNCWIPSGSNYNLAGSLNLCLTEDVTFNTEYRLMGATLNLCLNGHTVTLEENGRITSNGETGDLRITDCGESGRIVAAEGCRTSPFYTWGGKLSIYGGTIDASGCAVGNNGGAIYLGVDGDELNIFGGRVIGSRVSGNGGTLYSDKNTTVTVSGGTVSGGSASGIPRANDVPGLTGGIYLAWNAGTFTLGGDAMISGNAGSDICLGTNSTNRIHLQSWTGSNAVLAKLDGTLGTVVAVSATSADEARFVSLNESYTLLCHNGELIFYPALPAADHSHDGVSFVSVDANTFHNLWLASGENFFLPTDLNLCLTENITLSTEYQANGHKLNLCLNGHTVTMVETGRITANNGGSVDIHDCGDGRIEGAEGCRGSILYTWNGNLSIHGGTIDASGCASSKNGGAIYVGVAGDSLNISGGTVTGCTVTGNGGTIYCNVNATVTVSGGTVCGGTAANGGAVYMSAGTLTVSGGKISGGKAVNGGSICMNSGTLNISGGTVCDGQATNQGGSIYMGAAALNLTSGSITGGTAPSSGNIHMSSNDSLVTITGGTVSGGQATATAVSKGLGGNIHVIRGTLTVTGGTITGGSASGQTRAQDKAGLTGGIYLAWNAGTFTLGGDAVISGNNGSDICLGTNSTNKIHLQSWTGSGTALSKLDGTLGTVVAASATAADEARFVSLNEGYTLLCHNGELIFYPALAAADHSHDGVSFVGIDGETFRSLWLAGGENYILPINANLCLTEDVTLSTEYQLNGHTLNLCLGGKTITMEDSGRITTNKGGKLDLFDCGGGSITAASGVRNAFVYVQEGTMTLHSGVIDGSTISNGEAYGGAIYVNSANASFLMKGGSVKGAALAKDGAAFYVNSGSLTLSGGTIYGGTAGRGGAVFVNTGSFRMTGGEISGGTANKENEGRGGCVYLHEKGSTFTMEGGSIHGGTATQYGGNVGLNQAVSFTMTGGSIYDGTAPSGAGVNLGYSVEKAPTLGGSAKIYGNHTGADIHLGQNPSKGLNHLILQNWNGNGDKDILTVSRVSGAASTVAVPAVGTVLSYGDKTKIASYDSAYSVSFDGTNLVLLSSEYHYCCTCGGSLTGHSHVDTQYTKVTGAEFLAKLSEEGNGTYYLALTEGVTISSEYKLAGKTVYLCLNGQTVTMTGGGRITTNGGGSLNISDCIGTGNVTAVDNQISLFYTWGGTLNIYGGTINASGCKSGKNGGAIYVGVAGDSLNVYGGTIIGSKNVTGNGGTIYCNVNATVTISGGSIQNGQAVSGGNIYMNAGTLTISGGEIFGGTATGNASGNGGGNIYMNAGTLTISGGQIHSGQTTGTNASTGGGNVFVNTASVTIEGGEISYGTSGARGGNLYFHGNNGGFTMSGGLIHHGTAKLYGGNVGMNRGTFTMQGGEIHSGTVPSGQTGAGVNMGWSCGTITLSGNAKIYGNSGEADVRLGQSSNTWLILDGWNGNGTSNDGTTHPAMTISHRAGAAGIEVARANSGSLSDADLKKIAYMDNAFGLALSDDSTKILLTEAN